MGLKIDLENLGKIDALIEPMLSAARIPGAAIGIAVGQRMVFAKGYGFRDLEDKLPVTSRTIYPIASTTKAINATILGMLVDEGLLAWDMRVQDYLPWFQLRDPIASYYSTVRDLVVMRTGLPRHDWTWLDHQVARSELIQRLRYLEPSAGFREKFQYNNLTVTAAGHIAETVTGRSWEDLVQERILGPLGMDSTVFGLPLSGDITLSYHEKIPRKLRLIRRLAGEVTGPSGGSVHSTVEDMARWMSFNLGQGEVQGCRLIRSQTLEEIHAPQIPARTDPCCPTPNAAYAIGWFVDTYNGHARVAHAGNMHSVNSEVALFPQDGVGIVSFINFGSQGLTRLINQQVFDVLMGLEPAETLEKVLVQCETRVGEALARTASVRRVEGTLPSHPVDEYAGSYVNPGYGQIEIEPSGLELILRWNSLVLTLEHWHFDAWLAMESQQFSPYARHAFDRTSLFTFNTNGAGEIASVSIGLEPAVAPIRFARIS